MVDWAKQIRHLVDVDFPLAEKVVLVMNNLNTHKPASLYEAFEPYEARRIMDRLEIHYTPKHGSWLNMAEIEFSVLNRTGLPERKSLPGVDTVTPRTLVKGIPMSDICCSDAVL